MMMQPMKPAPICSTRAPGPPWPRSRARLRKRPAGCTPAGRCRGSAADRARPGGDEQRVEGERLPSSSVTPGRAASTRPARGGRMRAASRSGVVAQQVPDSPMWPIRGVARIAMPRVRRLGSSPTEDSGCLLSDGLAAMTPAGGGGAEDEGLHLPRHRPSKNGRSETALRPAGRGPAGYSSQARAGLGWWAALGCPSRAPHSTPAASCRAC